jgi:4-hydroxybenzoate polyprenyltransferase
MTLKVAMEKKIRFHLARHLKLPRQELWRLLLKIMVIVLVYTLLFAYFVGYIWANDNLNWTACISIVFFFFPASGIRPGSSVFTNDLLDGEEDTFSSRSSSQSTKTRAVASTSKNHGNYLGLYPLFAYFVGYMSNLNGTACISISFFLSRFRHLPWIASSFN